MHRDASYSSFTVLVRYWLILYVLAYCYNIILYLLFITIISFNKWSEIAFGVKREEAMNAMQWNAAITSNQFTPFHAAGNGSGVKLRVNELRALRQEVNWNDCNEVERMEMNELQRLPAASTFISSTSLCSVSSIHVALCLHSLLLFHSSRR